MSKKHVIREGESVISIGVKYGFFPQTIWDDSANSDLRSQRENLNVLAPGDVVFIPDKTEKELSGATEQRHRYRRKGVPAILRLTILVSGQPRANKAFRLDVDGHLLKGQTDGQGKLEVPLPPDAKKGRLYIGDDEKPLELSFGHLDPVEEDRGALQRLSNLGYPTHDAQAVSEAVEPAIRRFQSEYGLSESGSLDKATCAKLAEVHDEAGEIKGAGE